MWLKLNTFFTYCVYNSRALSYTWETFSHHFPFHSIKSNHENPTSYLSSAFNQPFPTINLKCVSSIEIEDITKSLKIKNSHGYDKISSRILESSIYYISTPLTYICNRMLFSGIFPTRTKLSEVKPNI
jgi:hypothetical protein